MQLEDLARRTRATLCLGCGKCTGMCPLADLSPGYSPRRLVARALQGLEANGRQLVRECLTCGACEERCPEGVSFVRFVREARSALPQEERAVCPHHQVLAQTTRLMSEGKTSPDRLGWLTDDLKVAEKGDVYLFVGCLPLFDVVYEDLGVETVEIARSAIRVLNRLGIEPVVSADEVCCGHDLLWSGDPETYRKLAERNTRMITETGAKTIVTTCAECARTLALDYAETVPGFKIPVQHMTSFLAERMEELGLSQEEMSKRTVTYQDPCRLGRHLRVYDDPRTVLSGVPGVDLVEMEMSARNSRCCGTSGFSHCDAESRRLQTLRLESARETGAETLVTACPKCLIHFTCTQKENERRARIDGEAPAGKGIQTEDITVLVDSALQKSTAPAAGREKAAAVKGEG